MKSKILSEIDEMLEEESVKLKSAAKSESDFYTEFDEEFNGIALKLEKHDFLSNEFNFFLLVKSKILYIIHENSKNREFGHFNFALILFDFFMRVWNVKLNSSYDLKKYDSLQKDFKREYFNLNRYFHNEIYLPDDNYSEKRIHSIMKKMRG